MADFDINAWLEQTKTNEKEQGNAAIAKLKELMSGIKAAGFTDDIRFPFNGCGDSGDIEEPYHGLPDALVKWFADNKIIFDISSVYDWKDGVCTQRPVDPDAIYVHDLLYAVLEMAIPGWEINEGTDGDIVLNIEENRVVVRAEEKTVTENEYEF